MMKISVGRNASCFLPLSVSINPRLHDDIAATLEIEGNGIRRKMYTFGVHSFTYVLLFNSLTSVIYCVDCYVVFKLELFVLTTHTVHIPHFLLFVSDLISELRLGVVKIPELYDTWMC
jgi:hypothetical protein